MYIFIHIYILYIHNSRKNPMWALVPLSRRQSRRISLGDNGLPFELTNNEFVTVRWLGLWELPGWEWKCPLVN